MSANPLHVKTFFHEQSSTFSYLVRDRESSECVVIDPCLDIDHASCSIAASSADQVSEYISSNGLTCKYILETHAHADHLSAALYLKNKHGGQLVIGDTISLVQSTFAQIYAESEAFPTNGSQFDVLMADGDQLELSGHVLKAYHVPGHTPACMAYHLDDLLFVGDTLFMPDSGTARCDFPVETQQRFTTPSNVCSLYLSTHVSSFAMTTNPVVGNSRLRAPLVNKNAATYILIKLYLKASS